MSMKKLMLLAFLMLMWPRPSIAQEAMCKDCLEILAKNRTLTARVDELEDQVANSLENNYIGVVKILDAFIEYAESMVAGEVTAEELILVIQICKEEGRERYEETLRKLKEPL